MCSLSPGVVRLKCSFHFSCYLQNSFSRQRSILKKIQNSIFLSFIGHKSSVIVQSFQLCGKIKRDENEYVIAIKGKNSKKGAFLFCFVLTFIKNFLTLFIIKYIFK